VSVSVCVCVVCVRERVHESRNSNGERERRRTPGRSLSIPKNFMRDRSTRCYSETDGRYPMMRTFFGGETKADIYLHVQEERGDERDTVGYRLLSRSSEVCVTAEDI